MSFSTRSRSGSSAEDYLDWWNTTWKEREDLIKAAFGETSPPDVVSAYFWNDLEVRVPGACGMLFPPQPPRRTEWLTLSHGLTQPVSPDEVKSADSPSGYGWEFAVLSKAKPMWAVALLYQVITYLRQTRRRIDAGHRVPFTFAIDRDVQVVAKLGKPAHHDSTFGGIRALLFWPYLQYPTGFTTRTGSFGILVGTGITEAEWQLAKETSSPHMLLLLCEAGVGQVTDPKRATITESGRWASEWLRIRSMTPTEVDRRLADCYKRHNQDISD